MLVVSREDNGLKSYDDEENISKNRVGFIDATMSFGNDNVKPQLKVRARMEEGGEIRTYTHTPTSIIDAGQIVLSEYTLIEAKIEEEEDMSVMAWLDMMDGGCLLYTSPSPRDS